MNRFRAKVQNGPLPSDDEGDDLTDEQREALHNALAKSLDSLEKGHTRPVSALLHELHTR
jgi:hypothetical protein